MLARILPKPDRRSWLAYAVIACLVPITLLFLFVTGMRFRSGWPWALFPFALLMIFNAWMLRRAGHPTVSDEMETISLMVVKASFVVAIQYAVMALPIKFKDNSLLAADRFFGFDWLTFANAVNATLTFPVLLFSYNSLIWQGVLLLLLLCATGRDLRAWQTVSAAMVALAITTIVFAFFPADGRGAGCGPTFAGVPARAGACDYGTIIHGIKDDGLRIIDASMATGLVAMPSFHAAAGVIFIWSGWAFKWLRYPVLVLNGLMLIATITVGAHYMVDVPAGALVALLSIIVAKRFVGRSDQEAATGSGARLPDPSDLLPVT